ncbi:MAG: flagellar basal-body rod protein FlgG [Candidatus Margulisiibacteriota bacterium]|jgi:flagellar basal-body rod protein FlgG
MQQFYIGATGMESYQTDLMNITNNVSNAQTVGYKSSRVEYENLFPKVFEQVLQDSGYYDESAPKPAAEIGSGVRISGVTKDLNQGTIQVTSKELDLAIEGNGFFQFQLPDGTMAYTRAGNLRKTAEGNLTDPNGHPLYPPITIPSYAVKTTITAEGKVLVQDKIDSVGVEVGQITLTKFSNPSELKSIGQNLFLQTASSGEPVTGIPSYDNTGALAQGALEFSNVDVVSEMMRMVIVQRAFEIVSKMVQAGETMLRSATDIARS